MSKTLVRSKSGLKIVSSDQDCIYPLLLKEPPWVPDKDCIVCEECSARFAFITRRHHCRRCGNCFCGSCCQAKYPLLRMGLIDPVRQCGTCSLISEKENNFFDRSLKILHQGAEFSVRCSALPSDSEEVYWCKFSYDNRFIVFDRAPPGKELENIELSLVASGKITDPCLDALGNTVASGLTLTYTDGTGDRHSIRLRTKDETVEKRQPMLWIASMQKALKLLYDGRGEPTTPLTP